MPNCIFPYYRIFYLILCLYGHNLYCLQMLNIHKDNNGKSRCMCSGKCSSFIKINAIPSYSADSMVINNRIDAKYSFKRTFSLSQMSNVELARTLPWRENALFEEREKNVFVKPNEQCRACSNIVMARKRTFRGTREERS